MSKQHHKCLRLTVVNRKLVLYKGPPRFAADSSDRAPEEGIPKPVETNPTEDVEFNREVGEAALPLVVTTN